MIALDAIPVLPRGVRCTYDRLRDCDVLLGPERVLMLDTIGQAVLSRVDGQTPLSEICADLARSYDAPLATITADVRVYLGDLAEKRLVEFRDG